MSGEEEDLCGLILCLPSFSFTGTSCSSATAPMYYDELHIFNSFYDPSDIYRAKCGESLLFFYSLLLPPLTFVLVQSPPMPMLTTVFADHTFFNVTYFSFYAEFSKTPVTFVFNIGGTPFNEVKYPCFCSAIGYDFYSLCFFLSFIF